MSKIKLKNRRINKIVTFGCYIKTHIQSGNQEYKKIKIGIMKEPYNAPDGLPMQNSEFKFEYVGEWDREKYVNYEEQEEIKAVEPPMIEEVKQEPIIEDTKDEIEDIFIPDETPKKTTKRTRRSRKPKTE